ncbi:MAG TPA: prenyltransferase/squalene oxidase repeat-containing protein [Planctomycetota bacterium]|nr:prenyltransferase/squalene oxidase repeat-containing protein [Planctomycetota bacterium]
MAHLDPEEIKVQSDTVPIGATRNPFQQTMAQQLKRGPWFALSAAIHGVVLLLVAELITPERRPVEVKKLEVVDTQRDEVDAPPPPPPLEVVPEDVTGEVVVGETPVVTATEHIKGSTAIGVSRPTAFDAGSLDASEWTTVVGLDAGTDRLGPHGGGRGGGKGGGGTPWSEAIDSGLQWLKNHQDDDGKWDCDQFMKHDDPGSEPCDGAGNGVHDVGVTGLALLAFLGDGSTLRSGPHRATVKKAVSWLRSQQQESGLFGTSTSHDFVYDHAIAAYAMCEAFGLSGYESLRDNAQRGIDYLETHRNPSSVWRYTPHATDNDTSVTGWCVMAYESGDHFGLHINRSAMQMAATWFDKVSDPSGLTGYTKLGERSWRKSGEHTTKFPVEKGEALTAVALLCRFFMSQDPEEKPVMRAAADRILAKPPVWDEKSGAIDHYYWYYATSALFQMGGHHWTEWQQKLDTAVLENQLRDKQRQNLYGSWDPKCAWGEDGGRVYSTAILVLTLEAYRQRKLVR